jgi:hypothetical protein
MATSIDPKSTCLHLRSKQMFYKVPDPEEEAHRREVERLFGACDTTAYWCQCTQTGRGPDGEPANREECSRAGRRCFVSVQSLA